ncbi:MAG: CARDB domain-containing protein [Planctomycetota bacterium]|nr:CARDB domain-containing protein [Planctomycetota bacterium]
MTPKTLPSALLLFASIALLTACGGSSGGSDNAGGAADLAPAKAPGASFYYSTAAGAPVIHVVNQGTGAAPASTLTVVFSTFSGDVVNEFPVPALAPGEMSPPIVAPLPVGSSSTQVRMTVDSRSEIAESDETNNEDSETLLI